MGKMRRKTLPAFLTGFLCCLLAAGAGIEAAGDQAPQADASQTISVSQNVKLEVKGKPFVPKSKNGRELPVFLYDGAAYAPVRALANRLHYSVVYSSSERTVRMEPSPKPEEVEKDFLEKNLNKRMELVKTIEFRDQEGRKAVVDALADPEDPNDACCSWLDRLDCYWKVINKDGEKPEDYQGSGIDIVFLDEDGDCVCKYEDVSEHYVTYLGDYYTNEYYNILDIERIRRVLDGKPEEFEPEKLFDIGEAAWITISDNWDKTVRVDDKEIIREITDQFNSLECVRGEACIGWLGLPTSITWYDGQGHEVGYVAFNTSTTLRHNGFFQKVVSGSFDQKRLHQILEEYPDAELPDCLPIMNIGNRLPRAQCFAVANGDQTAKVTVSDPDLLKRVADNIGSIDFKMGQHLTTDPYAPADDGRIFLDWLTNNGPEEEDGMSSVLFPLCILDDRNIQFNYWQAKGNEYEAAAMDGKTIDKQLLDDLLDPNGPYADNPQVVYEKIK